MLARTVQPELLDSLPADDAAARRSRLDLRLINSLMGNVRWVEGRLRETGGHTSVIDLGAGEGRLSKRLDRRGLSVTGIDLAPRPDDLPASVRWFQGDLFQFTGFQDTTIVATLFLHHLQPLELARLGNRISNARVLLFSEPWRSRISLCCAYFLLPWVNHVTRHDMFASIRAGFRTGELPALLQLGPEWEIRESLSPYGACRMTAVKR